MKFPANLFDLPRLNAESMFMLSFAAALDIAGYCLLFVGLDDCGILDFLGFVIIGIWLFFSTGKLPNMQKTGFKFFSATFVEAIPYLGDISPSWIWLVWQALKEKQQMEEEQIQEQEEEETQEEEYEA